MKSNPTDYDYNLLASRFISDQTLSIKVQSNATFVENYLDKIDTSFKEEVEKQIAYREMGTIVYSCIEALLKSVLFEIDRRCKNIDCGKKDGCKYYRYRDLKSINRIHTIDSMLFLFNCGLFYLPPNEVNELRLLNELRNYVHISKNIGESINDNIFSKEYVKRMLNYYHKLLEQFNISGFYFEREKSCLAELDEDRFKCNIEQNSTSTDLYYNIRIDNAIRDIVYEKELSVEERMTFIVLGKYHSKVYKKTQKRIIESIERIRLFSCYDNDRYEKTKQILKKGLQKYFDEPFVEQLIKKCDEIRESNK